MTDNESRVPAWQQELSGASPDQILAWAAATFPGRVALASSLGVEDQVLTAMIAADKLDIAIFTLDTGRLFPETHDLIARTASRYGLPISVYVPEAADVEEMTRLHGVNLFRDSISARKRCCDVRKIRPLRRAQAGLDAWVCGLRRGQGVTRGDVDVVEWDASSGLVKINPLAAWDEACVWEYIRANDVPYNPLHDAGMPSIGCAPCTRAIAPEEDVRAGRWWWESAEQRECGLHAHRETGAADAGFSADNDTDTQRSS